ncbi:MAG TPA: phosphate ABC transporter permease subunit PstC [Pseudobdellovibrionaceae bacterium]|nr:phosphate ABC transporter permease subunit PstC [Pseudobdellovibrionaceae bacterium]
MISETGSKNRFAKQDSVVRRSRQATEFFIESLLRAVTWISILVTFGIVFVLVKDSLPFFQEVGLWDFLTDKEWTPLFDQPHFGISSLLAGTFSTTIIALTLAIPVGTLIAAFLSEMVSVNAREILKPILELLAGIPSVVFGYFALLMVTPFLQKFIPELPGFNVLSAGIVLGFMIIPYVTSLSEDAMRSVPDHLREASYALGANRLETAFKVVIPSSFSGMTSAYILALSRALGETMVVAISAGMQPKLTFDPREPAATVTAYIVQVSMGDLPHGSIGYRTIYAAGLSLFVITVMFNLIGMWIKKRYQERE